MQIVDIFRARIVDIGKDSLIIEATGDLGKINAIVSSMKPFGITEVVRTGKVAMVRGPKNDSE
jgi:acetolactate synthase-1/3 small subunit